MTNRCHVIIMLTQKSVCEIINSVDMLSVFTMYFKNLNMRHKMKKIILAVLALASTACASHQDYDNMGLNNENSNISAYIQMDDEYAMTAKHANVNNVVYECSVGCDLVFFKHPSNNYKQGIWRNPIVGERVTQVGSDSDGDAVEKQGKVLNQDIKPSADSQFFYMTTTAYTTKGMSGGPVYGQDGRLIGMTLGSPVMKDNDGVNSIFVSNEIIKVEWEKFKELSK